MIRGCVPLWLTDANVPGAGKGLLLWLAGLIGTGREPAVSHYTSDDEEMAKRITTIAKHADPYVRLDNIDGELGGSALEAAITETRWRNRLLGGNTEIDVPMRTVWTASGNNVVLTGDMPRRVCYLRLESPEERPEERTNFTIPDLRAWAHEERLHLTRDALTILRAWVCAGRPTRRLRPWGSFERWSAVVRQCLHWLGLPDPAATRVELRERSDSSGGSLAVLLGSWEAALGRHPLTAAQISSRITEPTAGPVVVEWREALVALVGSRTRMPTGSRAIGQVLAKYEGRVLNSMRVSRGDSDSHIHAIRWFRESLG